MVEIETKLYNDIKAYCKLNNLVIKDFINRLLKKAFTIEKYGETPFATSIKVEKEVIYSIPKIKTSTDNSNENIMEKSITQEVYNKTLGSEIVSCTPDTKNETNKKKKRQL